MITITDTIIVAVITMTIIAVAIITIPSITISPSPYKHPYVYNPWDATSRFRWEISVGDLPSP
jgi:hypothetical protein